MDYRVHLGGRALLNRKYKLAKSTGLCADGDAVDFATRHRW